MSRILKLGLGAAQLCLNDAGNIQPDAILIGSGLACIVDLETFLISIADGAEQGLSPIPFINSSHNTVAAQISRVQQNHAYSNTYCHRGTSFESALTDALMLINGQEASQILLGGVDEFSKHYYSLLEKIGEKTVAGEGAAFFILSSKPCEKTYARIASVKTFYRPSGDIISRFLSDAHLPVNDVDTVLLGINGDEKGDEIYYSAMGLFPAGTQFASYKRLCGEYMTSGSFALALTAHSLNEGKFPDSCVIRNARPPKRVLIFNHYRQQNYSLVLAEKQDVE
jgi:3-oxoacyl-(acyl-carrier-protein) synthase